MDSGDRLMGMPAHRPADEQAGRQTDGYADGLTAGDGKKIKPH